MFCNKDTVSYSNTFSTIENGFHLSAALYCVNNIYDKIRKVNLLTAFIIYLYSNKAGVFSKPNYCTKTLSIPSYLLPHFHLDVERRDRTLEILIWGRHYFSMIKK